MTELEFVLAMMGPLGHIFGRQPVIYPPGDGDFPSNGYITEDSLNFYITEDGLSYYVTES